MITYRLVTHPDEFEQLTDLEILIWGTSERDAVSARLLHVIQHCGGHILGAFDDEKQQIVGYTLALLARRDAEIRVWSHIAAVHPDYQNRGLGFALKQYQRLWALEQGYRDIHWTFDPLVTRNAYFNMRRLGAYSSTYHVNFYGEMPDSVNAGMPSDRLEVTWRLDDARVVDHANGNSYALHPDDEPLSFLLTQDSEANPQMGVLSQLDAPYYGVMIPNDINALKRYEMPKAKAWRFALRAVLQTVLQAGYSVVDFVGNNDQGYYMVGLRQD